MKQTNYLFTSESVSEGHPDKVCDRISDMVVDSYLSKDPFSRVACETLTTTNKVVLAGETRGPKINKDELVEKVRQCIKDIGYDQDGFSWKTAKIDIHLHEQSSDIAMGVDSKDNKDEGAGDQGIMFGYACSETENLMPAPIDFSHKILRLMATDRKNGSLIGIEPDSKSQVTMMYENGKPKSVTSVVISTQHSKNLNQEDVRNLIVPYIKKTLPKKYLEKLDTKEIYINPPGQFIIGGPDGDTGLTGRKIILILMVAQHLMEVALFLAKTQLKLIDLLLMLRGMLLKILLHQESLEMFNTASLCYWSLKTIIYIVKLADGDELKVEIKK